MRVTMLLCDHAQVADNKLFINGAGWDRCRTPAPPHAVAILVSVPWDKTNVPTDYRVELIHEDGQPVTVAGPSGPVPVATAGRFEVGRPSGLRPGSSISVPLVVNAGPLELRPDSGYEWRLSLGGQSSADWTLAFRTMP